MSEILSKEQIEKIRTESADLGLKDRMAIAEYYPMQLQTLIASHEALRARVEELEKQVEDAYYDAIERDEKADL